jgi:two-component system LytT family response regulator
VTKPVRTLIVDDEALARQRLRAMLVAEPLVEVVGEADGGGAAVSAIVDRRPELVFLDVQMPGLDGFGVLRCTAGAHRAVVVFVTAHEEHAVRAFEVQAVDYLLKPVTVARLHQAVSRAVERVRASTPEAAGRAIDALLEQVPPTPTAVARIPVRDAGGTRLVPAAEILRIESDRDHARLYTGGTVFTVRDTMAGLERRLAAFGFARVHRSVIVNTAMVVAVESIAKGDHVLVLRDGSRVRSGRRYRSQVATLLGRARRG